MPGGYHEQARILGVASLLGKTPRSGEWGAQESGKAQAKLEATQAWKAGLVAITRREYLQDLADELHIEDRFDEDDIRWNDIKASTRQAAIYHLQLNEKFHGTS